MVRLTDLTPSRRKSLESLDCPSFKDKPFAPPAEPLSRRVAIISTAGLIRRGDRPFMRGESGYRSFSSTVDNADVVISHISVNFDRIAALKNIEAIFPRDTLKEMVNEGEIGSVAEEHYSFMGATDPTSMEDEAKALVGKLREQGVNTAVLLPV